MVLLTDFQEFAQKATEMLKDLPTVTRITTKYRRAKRSLELKVTDNINTYRIKVTKEAQLQQALSFLSSMAITMADAKRLSMEQ